MARESRSAEVLTRRANGVVSRDAVRTASPGRSPRLTYVVPAHNEAETLPSTIPVLVKRLANAPGAEIIIVENGSSDATFDVASQLAAQCRTVEIVVTRSAPGIGAAYRAGIAVARGDHVVCSAADLPFGFTDIEGYLDAGCPVLAIGSKAHRDSVVERSALRWVMSFMFLLLRRIVLSMRVGDPQGTFLMQRELAQQLAPRCVEDGFAFTTELTALAEASGVTPVELPIALEPERRASTVRPFRDGTRVVAAMLRIRRRLRDDRLDRTRRWASTIDTGELRVRNVAMVAGAAIAVPVWVTLAAALASTFPAPLDVTIGALGVAVPAGVLVIVTRRHGEAASATASTMSDARVVAGGGPVRRAHDRTTVRLRFHVQRLAVYVGGALMMIWPASLHLATRYTGTRDNGYWYWLGWRFAQSVGHGSSIFHISDVVWPYGADILPADGFLPTLVAGGWNIVVPNAVLAFNLAVLTALVSTALAGSWLAARFTADRWLQTITGLVTMMATITSVRVAMHFNLLFTFPAVVLIGRAVEVSAGHRVRIVRDGLLLAACYWSSGYFLVYGLIAAAVLIVLSPREWRDGGDGRGPIWPIIGRSIAALGVCLLVLSPFLIAKLQVDRAEAAAGALPLSRESVMFSADPFSLLQPPIHTVALPGPVTSVSAYERYEQEATGFPGIVLLGALVVVATIPSRARRAVLATVGVLWLLSLGPRLTVNGATPIEHDWLPSALLTHLPGLRGMREPDRAAFLIVPLAACALAIVLQRVMSDPRVALRRRLVLGAVVVAAIAGAAIPIATEPASPAGPAVRQAMRTWGDEHTSDAVLLLPDQCSYSIHLVTLQMDVRRPLVGCQGFSASLPFASGMARYRASDAWASLRCLPQWLGPTVELSEFSHLQPSRDAVLALRQQLGVGLVVFDRDNTCHAIGDKVLSLLQELGTQLADDGRFIVFEMP